MKKTIAVLTSNRADYGLLKPLLQVLAQSSVLKPALLVSGSHLSMEHGHTIELIQQDGVEIAETVDLNIIGDEADDKCQELATGLSGFSTLFALHDYDALLLLGDRYELWAGALAAVMHNIPIVHIHGGEETTGVIDNVVRHSISKMAACHFVSHPAYAQRLLQMGENPERVHLVGAMGLDNLNTSDVATIAELQQVSGLDFSQHDVALVTFHPLTLQRQDYGLQPLRDLLDVLLETDLTILVTGANSDMGGKALNALLQQYADRVPQRILLKHSLGQRNYLAALQYARCMLGNSSSGIIESPSFALPVVNIGERQSGRITAANVIHSKTDRDAIQKALKKALSASFSDSLKGLTNPYDQGGASFKIAEELEKFCQLPRESVLEKCFYQKDES